MLTCGSRTSSCRSSGSMRLSTLSVSVISSELFDRFATALEPGVEISPATAATSESAATNSILYVRAISGSSDCRCLILLASLTRITPDSSSSATMLFAVSTACSATSQSWLRTSAVIAVPLMSLDGTMLRPA